MQAGRGYVVGTGAELSVLTDLDSPRTAFGGLGTEPPDDAEGVGDAATLEPQSLYEAMLDRRLR